MKNLVSLDTKLHCKTVFISDTHLGIPGCSADYLAERLNGSIKLLKWRDCGTRVMEHAA